MGQNYRCWTGCRGQTYFLPGSCTVKFGTYKAFAGSRRCRPTPALERSFASLRVLLHFRSVRPQLRRYGRRHMSRVSRQALSSAPEDARVVRCLRARCWPDGWGSGRRGSVASLVVRPVLVRAAMYLRAALPLRAQLGLAGKT